jgi:hypothetical protein
VAACTPALRRPAATAFALVTSLAACRESPRAAGDAERPEAAVPARRAPTATPAAQPGAATALPAPLETDEPETARDGGAAAWKLGDLGEVGPAGPAAVAPGGVVLVTTSDEVLVARLVPSRGKRLPSVAAIDVAPERMRASLPGPAIAGDHAYFVSRGRLVRRALDGSGALEVLATDAVDGTRVAAPAGVAVAESASLPDAVAYVARSEREDEGSVAKLWMQGRPPVRLTPAGAAASQVAIARAGAGLVVLALEARTGMSPLHARAVRPGPGAPALDEDVVTWIGGPADALTELGAVGRAPDAWAFVALERDASRFGLARISLGAAPHADSPVAWRTYPNGLRPAPLAAATVCGAPAIAYVRPAGAAPGSPAEVHVARIRDGVLGDSEQVGAGIAIAQVALGDAGGAGLVAWVDRNRTWARSLGCPDNR